MSSTASRKRPHVIVTRALPDAIETRLRELYDTQLRLDDTPMSPSELLEAVAEADVLVPTVTDQIDAKVIEAAGPQLKLIASFGTGVDHIDLRAAKAKGIAVANTPGVLTEDTADMTMALILAVSRRLVEGEQLVRSGDWTGWAPNAMLGHRITGKRLGIIGMGRIGTAVARRARAFGMQIHYHNRRRVMSEVEQELETTYWERLDHMLPRVDVISINCPRTPATFHLLNERRLKLVKSDATIVNTSRGEVIDEPALAALLTSGEIAAAGLDVFEREPAVNPKLLRAKNVVLLPHMGSATIEGRLDMGHKVLRNIQAHADGHSIPDRVVDEEF